MKRSLLLLTALLGAGSMIPGDVPLVTRILEATEHQTGTDSVRSVRNGYERGAYAPILKELDDDYRQHKDQLDGLIQTRPGLTAATETPSEVAALLQERNAQLREAIAGQPNQIVSHQVQALLESPLTESQLDAWNRFATYRLLPPGTAATAEENQLVDLDLEYEYKALHLELIAPEGANKAEIGLALAMEHLEKIGLVAANFEDVDLKQAASHLAASFDSLQAQAADRSALRDLALGKRPPANEIEAKVASILVAFETQRADLYR